MTTKNIQRRVYVDWDKIEMFIKQSKVDLRRYNHSHINYLSAKTGRPWSTIQRVRDEQSTTLKTIGEIASALGCHPVDIISAVGYPAPKAKALGVLSSTEPFPVMER